MGITDLGVWLLVALAMISIGVVLGRVISSRFTPPPLDHSHDGRNSDGLSEARNVRIRSQRVRSHARDGYYGTEDFDDAFNLKDQSEYREDSD